MFRSAIATDKSSLTEMNGRDCRSPRIKKGGKKWTCFLFYGQARRGLQIQKQWSAMIAKIYTDILLLYIDFDGVLTIFSPYKLIRSPRLVILVMPREHKFHWPQSAIDPQHEHYWV